MSRPLALFVGGASGAGKSTLSMEIAASLQVRTVVTTDVVRAILREATPSDRRLFGSSHELAWSAFQDQAAAVWRGVEAALQRFGAIEESLIVEGVHVLPRLVAGSAWPWRKVDVYVVPPPDTHRGQLSTLFQIVRPGRATRVRPDVLDAIGLLSERIQQEAEWANCPILHSGTGHRELRTLIAARGR